MVSANLCNQYIILICNHHCTNALQYHDGDLSHQSQIMTSLNKMGISIP